MNNIDTSGTAVDVKKSSADGQQAIKTQITVQTPDNAISQGAVQARANITDRDKSAEAPDTINPPKAREELEAVVKEVNITLQQSTRDLEFSVDDKSGERVVVVKDGSSGQTIRSIPSETMLRIANTIQDLRGLIYDDKA